MLLIIISPFWSAFYSHQKGLSFRLTKCINWQQAEFVVAHCVNNPKYESKGKVGLHLTTTQSLRQTSSNHHNRTLSASVLLVQPILTWLVGLIIGCGESNVMSTYFAMHVPHSEDVSQSASIPYNTWMSFGTSAAWGGMLGARGININEGPTTISKPSINTRRNEASTSLGNSAMEHNIDVWKKSKAGLFETCG